MSKGVLLFAHNNSTVDYVKQADFCAKQIQKHLKLPVCLITSNEVCEQNNFNHVIFVKSPDQIQKRSYYDGNEHHKDFWNNQSRPDAYKLTPYEETIVMDTDYIVSNDSLNKVFDSKEDFLINYKAQHVDFNSKYTDEMKYVSDTSIEMCWATVFYFKKTERTRILFELIDHIRNEWEFYRFKYQITNTNYRNDFAFAIALHMMNGFAESQWPKQLPCKLFYVTDKDIVESYSNNQWHFTLQSGLKCKLQDMNIHIMNKIGLNKIIEAHE
jgi:hypothetical protein